MTVLDSRPGPTAYGTARLLAGVTSGRPADLARHREHHGEQRFHGHGDLAALADQVRLLGRGGAAFPVGTKLRAMPVEDRGQVRAGADERAAGHEVPDPVDAHRAAALLVLANQRLAIHSLTSTGIVAEALTASSSSAPNERIASITFDVLSGRLHART